MMEKFTIYKPSRPNENEIVQLLIDGWRLQEKRNYNMTRIMSYYLAHKDYRVEFPVNKVMRDRLVKKGVINEFDILIKQ
jgi:hypothetical protein